MDKSRLAWACRRGMLELDLLLRPFFENEFTVLSPAEQKFFEQLLTESDQDLYAWILNFKPCTISSFQPLLAKIRAYHGIA
jgi:antitoxin CptB